MSDHIPPTHWFWDGEALRPRYPAIADKHFIVGERYVMVLHEERSRNSHNFFFASVTEAFKNLPENLAERFTDADHLRKYALIQTGFRTERSIVAQSPEEAQAIAAFIEPMDTYAVVVVNDCVVTVYNAKSQSMRAMGKAQFSESKNAVLDFLSRMIGVERENLENNAGLQRER